MFWKKKKSIPEVFYIVASVDLVVFNKKTQETVYKATVEKHPDSIGLKTWYKDRCTGGTVFVYEMFPNSFGLDLEDFSSMTVLEYSMSPGLGYMIKSDIQKLVLPEQKNE